MIMNGKKSSNRKKNWRRTLGLEMSLGRTFELLRRVKLTWAISNTHATLYVHYQVKCLHIKSGVETRNCTQISALAWMGLFHRFSNFVNFCQKCKNPDQTSFIAGGGSNKPLPRRCSVSLEILHFVKNCIVFLRLWNEVWSGAVILQQFSVNHTLDGWQLTTTFL